MDFKIEGVLNLSLLIITLKLLPCTEDFLRT